jgi:hypothetical protein
MTYAHEFSSPPLKRGSENVHDDALFVLHETTHNHACDLQAQ